MNVDVSDTVIFLIVVGLRFGIPLLIPRYPLPAIIAALVLDAADQSIFQQFTDLNLDGYQSYDKALDIYYLTIAYVSTFRNWTNGFAVEVARFLWYYRLVGVVLFELTETRFLLLVFPNTFEYFFIAYEVIRLGWDPRRLSNRHVVGLAAAIWIFIKLPQEYWIHVAQLDFTDFVKETLYGVDGTTSWSDTFANRPQVSIALAIAFGVLGAVAFRLWRRLPAQDWPLGFNVDRPTPQVDLGPDYEVREPSLRWPLVEKIALITMISVIFANVLNINAAVWQIAIATGLVVVATAGISLWRAKSSADWRSAATTFAIIAIVNAALIGLYANFVGEQGINRAAALFFGVLLTLIITLFDRFRAVRLLRQTA
jgi:hypothetical protein